MSNLNYIISATRMALSFQNPETDKFVNIRLEKSDDRYPALLEILEPTSPATSLATETTEERIMELIYPKSIQNDAVTVSVNGQIEFNGVVLPAVLARKLQALAKEGVSTTPFERFMERLAQNPSANSVNELYDFLSYRDLPITADGYFLAYKGIENDYWSKRGNVETIVEEGEVDEDGRILNKVGSTIRVNRNQVDDDRNNQCSFGLHVGSHDYASGWGPRMVMVKVDPADAVSVPTDCQFQKLRVSAYEIIADYEQEVLSQSTTENGQEVVSERVESLHNAAYDRTAYISRVGEYLESVAEELEFEWDEEEVTINEILGRVGGTTASVKDALQSLEVDWCDVEEVVYI